MTRPVWRWAATALAVTATVRAADFVFDVPSDDRWHYPFNFVPGDRATAGCFGAFGNPDFPDFNDRDGIMVVAWDTSSQIETDPALDANDVCAVSIRTTNIPGATWPIDLTLDNVATFHGQVDADSGRPIELFGAGFGPEYDYSTWNEFELYAGGRCNFAGTVCSNDPRDPFPFAFRDGSDQMLHVEDSVKGTQNEDVVPALCGGTKCPFTPIPWAIGVPMDYVPGAQTTPFDVRFDVDLALSDGRVRRYFQEQINGGRVFVVITTLQLVDLRAGQSTYPTFFSKEAFGPGVKPAQLLIRLQSDPPGDFDGDGMITPDELDPLVLCMSGPNTAISPLPPLTRATCRCALDADHDADIDLRDIATVFSMYPDGQ